MVRTPAEDAIPSATEAAAKVQTERKEEEARRDFFMVGESRQQRSDRDQTGVNGEVLSTDPVQQPNPNWYKVEQLHPAQCL